LPISGIRRNESGIVNLDNAKDPGTHWVAYAKRDNHVIYFDSFGNLRTAKELVRYFGNDMTKIEHNRTPYQTYNRTPYQTYNQSICGQLCLQFLQTVNVCQFKARQCAINSVFVGRFFNYVVDTYTNWKEQRPLYNLFSSHRLK